MKSILEYQDYRIYIRDYYLEMKSKFLLSWRIFAKRAGFVSPSYIKLVCENKANLSDEGIIQLSKAMGLDSRDSEYFALLVHLNQAKLLEDKQALLAKAADFAQKYKVNILNRDMFGYFSSWLNPVLHELAPTVSSNKTSEIARRFVSPVTGAQVKNSLKFLVKNGFLIQKDDGSYCKAEKDFVPMGKDESLSALRDFHYQMGNLALEALDKVPVNERYYSESVMKVTKESYARILSEMETFKKRIEEIAAADKGIDRMYSLNMQMIPLTHKNTGKNDSDDSKEESKAE